MTSYWSREQLNDQLKPINFTAPASLSDSEQAYCTYYRIDKETRITGVSHRLGYFESLGFRIAMHVYAPPRSKGTVFVLHGYFDHVGLYGHLIEHLLREGYAVVAYDQPGHGISGGEPVSIKSFAQYQSVLTKCLRLCREAMPTPWFAVGQSTGAAVLVDYMFQHRFSVADSPFRHWALLAPLVRPVGWGKALWLHTFLGPFIRTWGRAFKINSNDPDFLRFLKEKDPLQSRSVSIDWISALRRWIKRIESSSSLELPITIVQGREDTTVDWKHNIPHLKKLLPNANVLFLERGRHQLVNEAQEIRGQVFNWVTEAFDVSFGSAKIQEKTDKLI